MRKKSLPVLQIEIDIFSGRKNPKWVLTEQQTKEFFEFPQWQEMMVTDENAQNFDFGFNGFVVTKLSDQGTDIPWSFRLVNPYRPHYYLENLLTKLSQKEMVAREEWLIKTAGELESYEETISDLLKFIKKKIIPPTQSKDTLVKSKAPESATLCKTLDLSFLPNSWNNSKHTLKWNNCYNYATNCKNNTYAQPGHKEGYKTRLKSCSNVIVAAVADGMVLETKCKRSWSYYYIALAVAPGIDYHWYRQQIQTNNPPHNIMWGHKRGEGPVINFDASGKVIYNPQTCNRDYTKSGGANYFDFCGFYYWIPGVTVS